MSKARMDVDTSEWIVGPDEDVVVVKPVTQEKRYHKLVGDADDPDVKCSTVPRRRGKWNVKKRLILGDFFGPCEKCWGKNE